MHAEEYGYRAGERRNLVAAVTAARAEAIPADWFAKGEVKVWVAVDGGVHQKYNYRCEMTKAEEDGATVEMSLDGLSGGEVTLCEKCWSGKAFTSFLGHSGLSRQLAIVLRLRSNRHDVLRLKAQVDAYRKGSVEKGPSDSTLARVLKSAAGVEKCVEGWNKYYPNLAEPIVTFQMAVRELRQVAGSSISYKNFEREVLLERIRTKVRPKWWSGEAPVLDEAPCLVGFSHRPRFGGNDQAAELAMRMFACERDGAGTVLVVPGFICDYLLMNGGRGDANFRRNGLVQRMEVPGDPLVVETAAVLWDPEDSGPLKDLTKAVEAATEVLKSKVV
jgi:hypothetical protein